jgi:hypothetical protein
MPPGMSHIIHDNPREEEIKINKKI